MTTNRQVKIKAILESLSWVKLPIQHDRIARHHWLWLVGISLLFYSIVITAAFIPHAKIQYKDIKEKIQASKLNLFQITQSNHPDKKNYLRSQLATFNRLSAVTSDLNTNALDNGIQISDVSYQPVPSTSPADVFKIQITTHLKGGYPTVKKIIAGLLAAHDGLALDSLGIERISPTEAISNMELNFIFYYR